MHTIYSVKIKKKHQHFVKIFNLLYFHIFLRKVKQVVIYTVTINNELKVLETLQTTKFLSLSQVDKSMHTLIQHDQQNIMQ